MNNKPAGKFRTKFTISAIVCFLLLAASSLVCAASYNVLANPNNVATTPQTTPPTIPPTVYLSPTNVIGHPCTLWVQQDINNYLAMLPTNPVLQSAYNSQLSYVNKRLTLTSSTCTYSIYGGPISLPGVSFTPQGVPIAQTGTDGSAIYLGDCTDVSAYNGGVITQLGMMYVLTGSQQYGEYARQMLLSYANYYSHYGHPAGWTINKYRSALDGRLSYQFLNDAFFLCNIAFGYDLIRNLPTLTSTDQDNIRVNLLEAIAAEFTDPILGTPDYLSQGHNRSAISAAGVLMAGYASDDSKLINEALYGTGGTAQNPTGGITKVHMGSNILSDGLWIESSIGYQTSIASCGVFDAAIMMEHHGIDAFGQYPLKRLLDSAIYMAYPVSNMLVPNVGNTAPTALLSKLNYVSPEIGQSYWYGYQYYRDPNYLPIMRNQIQQLMMTAHNGAPSLFLTAPTSPWTITQGSMTATVTSGSSIFTWLMNNGYFNESYGTEGDPVPLTGSMVSAVQNAYPAQSGTVINILQTALSKEVSPSVDNANFFANGYGILRLATPTSPSQLLVEYGDNNKSHGQPAALSLDLYALGGTLMSLPGDIFPYNDPLDAAWYWTTLANNTVTVDGTSQIYGGNYYTFPKANQKPYTAQIVFGTAQTMGIQKVSSTGTNSVYAQFGVTQDRAVFMSPNYTADLFGNFSSTTHTYDLAWHPVGTMATSLDLSPRASDDFTSPGYKAMTNLQNAFPSGSWTAQITMPSGNVATLYAAANPLTEVITGNGHLITYDSGSTDTLPPVILERNSNVANTIFGNVIDVSGSSSGYVNGVTQEGGLSSGYALLKVQTVTGGTDLCYTSYSSGTFTTQGNALTTDAQQAFVLMNGTKQGMYLGGGTRLTAAGCSIQRVDSVTLGGPGLAYVEPTATGYVVGNMSPTNATVTVSLAGVGSGTASINANATIPSVSVGNATVINVISGTIGCALTVTLAEASSQTVTVNYATANGSAVSGSNYIAQSGMLTFAPGVTAQTITVPVMGNPDPSAPSRIFTVNLSGAVNAMVLGNQGVGTILPTIISGSLSVTATNGSNFVYWITGSNNPTNCTAMGLPPGVSINPATGMISGILISTGTFSIPITASNAAGTESATLVLTIPPSSTAITSALAATGSNGSSFIYHITASNSPTSFNVLGLPAGLSINNATGVISGTPSVTGTFAPILFANNAGGTGAAKLTLTILPQPPVITSTNAATVANNNPFNYRITASNSPTSYNATGLPAGLSIDTATGLISGTPTVTGTFNTTISASNAGGTGSASLVLSVPVTYYGIAAGYRHSVALKDDGTVWTWGDNVYGQLGNGTTTGTNRGTQVSGLSNVKAVAAGGYHTLALKQDGTVWVFGSGTYGQLGNGTTTGTQTTPVQVSGLSNVVKIVAGGNHSFATKSDGTIWGWGQGSYGQLGNGASVNKTTPVQISALSNIVQILGGNSHSIALKADGTVWIWGGGYNGCLGNGTTTGTNSPIKVSGLSNIASVGIGNSYSAAVTTTGSVYNWGRNSNGQLGNSGTTDSLVPILVNGVSNVTKIEGGDAHTIALTSTGQLWAWGCDASGQLGDGTKVDKWVPTQITSVTGVTDASAGSGFTLYLKSDGTIWGVGSNYYLTLGDGTGSARTTPVQALGVDLFGANGSVAPPGITSALMATGTSGSAFSYQITGSNSPTSFGAAGLPDGLSVDPGAGVISGTPTVTGTFSATIIASNSGGPTTATLTMTILPQIPGITSALTLTSTNGIAFTPFTYNITASNSPSSYNATGLPAGLNVNTATGMIFGTPSMTGTSSVTICASNASGTSSGTLTLIVLPTLPSINSALAATGANGLGFSYTITALNTPTSYNATGLPAGLSIDTATGIISGTPTVTGTFSPTISAANAGGTNTATLTISVLSHYKGWKMQKFTALELLDANTSGDTAAPSGDGISNLIKYALGLSPKVHYSRSATLPFALQQTVNGAGYLSMSFTRDTTATDMLYSIEAASDLNGSWISIDPLAPANQVSILANTPAAGIQTITVKDVQPVTNSDRRVMRLRLTTSTPGEVSSGTTPGVGYVSIVCKASSDTIVSSALSHAPDYVGTISGTPTLSGSAVTITASGTASPGWAANYFAALYTATPSYPTYYVKFTSGTLNGKYFTVMSNSGNTLTFDTGGDIVTGLAAADSFALIKYWTLGDLFPPATQNTFVVSGGNLPPLRKSMLLVPDLVSHGTNLAPTQKFFVTASGWKTDTTGYPNATNQILYPDTYFIVRHPDGADTSFTIYGSVNTDHWVTHFDTLTGGQQDNFVALQRPQGVSLAASGLATGFIPSGNNLPPLRRDVLLIFDNSQIAKNKAPNRKFFMVGSHWIEDTSSYPNADTFVLSPGTGFLIRKYPTSTGTASFWSNNPNY